MFSDDLIEDFTAAVQKNIGYAAARNTSAALAELYRQLLENEPGKAAALTMTIKLSLSAISPRSLTGCVSSVNFIVKRNFSDCDFSPFDVDSLQPELPFKVDDTPSEDISKEENAREKKLISDCKIKGLKLLRHRITDNNLVFCDKFVFSDNSWIPILIPDTIADSFFVDVDERDYSVLIGRSGELTFNSIDRLAASGLDYTIDNAQIY